MALEVGIVGLPNVGKSTIFNALTAAGAEATNYPFSTVQPNVGVVPVPDERLAIINQFQETKKIVPATVRVVDIAGIAAAPAPAKVWATSSSPTSARSTPSCTSSAVLPPPT